LTAATLVGLRQSRKAKVLRAIGLARATVRAERSDLARIAREWRGVSKRINLALVKYQTAVNDLGIFAPGPLQPADLIRCIKECVGEEQGTRLDDIEAELSEHEKEIRDAGKKRARKVARKRARA
jgi:hypothetical protein